MIFKIFISVFLCIAFCNNVHSELVIGVSADSVGYGLPMNFDKGWVSLIQKDLKQEGYDVKFIYQFLNGITENALPTLDNFLNEEKKIDVFFICLGINDCLRFYDFDFVKTNIQKAIDEARKYNIQTFVGRVDMSFFGQPESHFNNFKFIYDELENKNSDVIFFDYVYPEIIRKDGLHVGDYIHPNEKGQKIIKENIKKLLVKYLSYSSG